MTVLGKPEIVKSWAEKDQNVYCREVLYQETWNFPITEVAKKCTVSDVIIHRVYREMEIPTPPVGYWAKNKSSTISYILLKSTAASFLRNKCSADTKLSVSTI